MQTQVDRFTRRIRTTLYQDQRFSEAELELLHTPSLQRLYDLRQLGLADRVFIDASHTRLAHVIGVMEIAGKMVAAIKRNLAKGAKTRGELTWSLGKDQHASTNCNELEKHLDNRLPAIRLIALLHDLTHAPYGHTLEDEIELVHPSHDAPTRQAEAFRKLIHELISWLAKETFEPKEIIATTSAFPFDHTLAGASEPNTASDEAVVALGIKLLNRGKSGHVKALPPEQLAELLININFASRALYYLELSHKFKKPDDDVLPQPSYPANQIIEKILLGALSSERARTWQDLMKDEKKGTTQHPDTFHPKRDAYCLDIIGDTICADLLDYAQRDSVQAGLPLAFDLNRIVDNFTIISHEEPDSTKPECDSHPFNGSCLRAAVDFSSGKFRGDAIGELIELLQVRYYVYERMLFHPTKCVAGGMLGSAIQLLGFKQIPTEWQKTGDAVFLQSIREVSSACRQMLQRAIDEKRVEPATHFDGGAWKKVIDTLPPLNVGAIRNTRELLKQRLLTMQEVRSKFAGPKPAQLWMSRLLHGDSRLPQHNLLVIESLSAALDTKKLKELDKSTAVDVGVFGFIESATLEIAAKRAQKPGEITNSIVRKVLTETLQLSVQHILDDLAAADETMSCLIARRYARRVFCLMPANIVAKNIPVDVQVVAERFLNPEVRFAAERTIEKLCKLSKGSVVIHCPPATGPRKIARVLTTYIPPLSAADSPPPNPESRRETVQLKDIGLIRGPANTLFRSHHDHVESLERMYSSMWRLWVAVLPPDDIAYNSIAAVISKVIAAVVFDGGGYVTVSNDAFMVEEMNLAYTQSDSDESPDPATLLTKTPTSDTTISPEELNALLRGYLSVFTSRKQRYLEGTLLSPESLTSMCERATPADVKRLRACQLPFAFANPEWDARDAKRYCDKIAALADFKQLSLRFDDEPRYRVLSGDEKALMSKLEAIAKAELRYTDFKTAGGAISLSLIASKNGINVLFQPLLCLGLFGIADGNPVIIIDSGDKDPKSLLKIHTSGESEELLPLVSRKTLAHELMHYFIYRAGRKAAALGTNEDRIAEITEVFCEKAAEDILLPESIVTDFLRDAPFNAPKAYDGCRRLGVCPDTLIRAIIKNPLFNEITRGLGFILAKADNSQRLQVLEAACNHALEVKAATLRGLSRGVTLPFRDTISNNSADRNQTIEIEAAQASASSKITIELGVTRLTAITPDNNLRFIVIQI